MPWRACAHRVRQRVGVATAPGVALEEPPHLLGGVDLHGVLACTGNRRAARPLVSPILDGMQDHVSVLVAAGIAPAQDVALGRERLRGGITAVETSQGGNPFLRAHKVAGRLDQVGRVAQGEHLDQAALVGHHPIGRAMKGHCRHRSRGIAGCHVNHGARHGADGSHSIRRIAADAHRHPAAVGKAVDIDPGAIHRRQGREIIYEVAEELHIVDLTCAPGVARIPAPGVRRTLGIDHDKAFAVSQLVPAAYRGLGIGIQHKPVQADDHRCRLGRIVAWRDVEMVAALATTGDNCPGRPACLRRSLRRRCALQRGARRPKGPGSDGDQAQEQHKHRKGSQKATPAS